MRKQEPAWHATPTLLLARRGPNRCASTSPPHPQRNAIPTHVRHDTAGAGIILIIHMVRYLWHHLPAVGPRSLLVLTSHAQWLVRRKGRSHSHVVNWPCKGVVHQLSQKEASHMLTALPREHALVAGEVTNHPHSSCTCCTCRRQLRQRLCVGHQLPCQCALRQSR